MTSFSSDVAFHDAVTRFKSNVCCQTQKLSKNPTESIKWTILYFESEKKQKFRCKTFFFWLGGLIEFLQKDLSVSLS